METKRGNQAHKVIVKKIIHADSETIFNAWTKPEIMQHWYVGAKGKSNSTVDLRVGGAYSNDMIIEGSSSCNKNEETGIKHYMHTGEYLEIIPNEKLVFTWNSPSVQNTKVTVDLKKVEGGTEVTITHELSSQEDCEGHTQGWTFALSNLATLLG